MDEIKGKLNQASGELTDDQMQVLKGRIQESIGKGKENSADALNEISRSINEQIEEFKRKNKSNN